MDLGWSVGKFCMGDGFLSMSIGVSGLGNGQLGVGATYLGTNIMVLSMASMKHDLCGLGPSFNGLRPGHRTEVLSPMFLDLGLGVSKLGAEARYLGTVAGGLGHRHLGLRLNIDGLGFGR